jgi:hypothetical protein
VKSIKEDAAVVADAYRQRAVLLYQRQRQDGDQHGETIPETAQASRETSRWLAQSQPLLASFCSFGKLVLRRVEVQQLAALQRKEVVTRHPQ